MSDDIIYREDAINSIYKLKKIVIKHKDLSYHDGLFDALEVIQDLPSADKSQGKWVGEANEYADRKFVYDTWHCSNCDYVINDDEPPVYNFCPMCGTRMNGRKIKRNE